MSAQLSTVGGRGGGELGVLYQGRQGSVSAHLSTGMGGGGGGGGSGCQKFFIKADRGQCQLTCLQYGGEWGESRVLY